MDAAVAGLEGLAGSDATVAPLVRLRAEALRAAGDAAWEGMVPAFDRASLAAGTPLLADALVEVRREPVRGLLRRLSELAGPAACIPAALDELALLEAAVNQDDERLAGIGGGAEGGAGQIASIGQELAVPLLLACGRRAAPLLDAGGWSQGYCPVCAAWPALAETRGVERRRWLRCGRCGTAWPYPHLVCAFCGNADHRAQGYLAAEDTREARRASTCERCHGYLKAVASPLPMGPHEVFVQDVATLELDVAALSEGYARPEEPAFDLGVRIAPAPTIPRVLRS